MKAVNYGMEKIEFGFNQNTIRKKEGGYYSVEVGQTIELPDEARDFITNPDSGPGIYGLVPVAYGVPDKDLQVNGLQKYIETKRRALGLEHQRKAEEEQVGIKHFVEPIKLKLFEKQLQEAELKLESVLGAKDGDTIGDGNQNKKKLG